MTCPQTGHKSRLLWTWGRRPCETSDGYRHPRSRSSSVGSPFSQQSEELIQHAVKMRCCSGYRCVLGLGGRRLRRQNRASVDVFEVAIGKLMACLGPFRRIRVNAKEPGAITANAVGTDERIPLTRGGAVSAP